MTHARVIVMAIVMMAGPAAPARAQEHGAAPAQGKGAAKGGSPAHAAAPEHVAKTAKAAEPTPAAAAKAAPAGPAVALTASDAVARITRRLDQELAKPTSKAARTVGPEAGNTHAGAARSGGPARGRQPAERPRVNLEWRLSVEWTAAADALSGRHAAAETGVARPALLEACANPLHFHLEAGESQSLLKPLVLPRRPNR